MKEKKTNLLQVLARRALLVALDGAIVAFSFYFALLLRADGAVEASWWPHNRALLYANLPGSCSLSAQLSGRAALHHPLEVRRGRVTSSVWPG